MRQLLQPQLLVVRCRVAPPEHQEARDAAHHPTVEQQLHLVLALLPQVGYRPGTRWHPGPHEQGLVDRRAAAHLAPQGEGVDDRRPALGAILADSDSLLDSASHGPGGPWAPLPSGPGRRASPHLEPWYT